MRQLQTCLAVLFLAIGPVGSGQASASIATATFGFEAITNNSSASVAIAESQLFLDLIDIGNGQVQFDFRNVGPDAAVISEVYFEAPRLFGPASLALIDADENNGQSGVNFSPGANPPDLPGGTGITPPFNVTASLLADANNPAPRNGVGPGETLGVLLDLAAGLTFTNVLDAFNEAINQPASIPNPDIATIRVGVHVIDFDNGASESLINSLPPLPQPVPDNLPEAPEPSGFATWGLLAMAGAGFGRRRTIRS